MKITLYLGCGKNDNRLNLPKTDCYNLFEHPARDHILPISTMLNAENHVGQEKSGSPESRLPHPVGKNFWKKQILLSSRNI